MSVTQTIPVIDAQTKVHRFVRTEWVIGLVIGLAGGALERAALGTSLTHGLAVGGVFGLIFALRIAPSDRKAVAGLIH